MLGHMADLQRRKTTLRKRNFIERIKALILLEAFLANETM